MNKFKYWLNKHIWPFNRISSLKYDNAILAYYAGNNVLSLKFINTPKHDKEKPYIAYYETEPFTKITVNKVPGIEQDLKVHFETKILLKDNVFVNKTIDGYSFKHMDNDTKNIFQRHVYNAIESDIIKYVTENVTNQLFELMEA